MKRERPGAVLVLAVLTILVGCGGILAGFLSLVTALRCRSFPVESVVNSGRSYDLMVFLNRKLSGYDFFDMGRPIAILGLAIIFLLVGFDLLRMRRGARLTLIVVAVLSLVLQLGVLLYTAGFVLPALENVQEEDALQDFSIPRSLAQKIDNKKWEREWENFYGGILLLLTTTLLFVLHALAALVVLFAPVVVGAFATRARPPTREEPPLVEAVS